MIYIFSERYICDNKQSYSHLTIRFTKFPLNVIATCVVGGWMLEQWISESLLVLYQWPHPPLPAQEVDVMKEDGNNIGLLYKQKKIVMFIFIFSIIAIKKRRNKFTLTVLEKPRNPVHTCGKQYISSFPLWLILSK